MKPLLLFLTFVVMALSPAVQRSHKSRIGPGDFLKRSNQVKNDGLGVINGNNTTIKKHPYLVSLIMGHGADSCVGTIVSKNWIVTVPECFEDYSPSEMTVIAGSQDGLTGNATYKLKKVVNYPKYIRFGIYYQFACAKIRGSFQWSDKVQPIKLARNTPPANTTMVTAGWGTASSAFKLTEAKMTWYSKSYCKWYFDGYLNWKNKTMACAYDEERQTLCRGDRGDPFVYKGSLYGQFATQLFGKCSEDAGPVILADITGASSWIKNITGASFEDE